MESPGMPPGSPGAGLAEQRAETVRRIAALDREVAGIVAAAAGSNLDDEHDPEGSTIAFERAQAQSRLEEARGYLRELDEAVQRIADGTYGVCARCGRPISPERLDARPTATRCISCAGSRR